MGPIHIHQTGKTVMKMKMMMKMMMMVLRNIAGRLGDGGGACGG